MISTVTLRKMLFIPVPPEQDMMYRTYESRITNQSIHDFEIATKGGKDISREAISKISGNILTPSAMASGVINIQGGWNSKRFSVFIEFETNGVSGRTIETFAGYTGYSDVSFGGLLDPNTPIYINSHSQILITNNRVGNAGPMHQQIALGSKQILNPVSYTTSDHVNMNADIPIRPIDTIYSLQNASHNLGSDVFDTRSSITNNLISSRHDNMLSSRYLSNICEGYRNAVAINGDMSKSTIYGSASANRHIVEDTLTDNLVFMRLIEQTNYFTDRFVTVGDIEATWRNAKDVTHVFPTRDPGFTNIDRSNHWGGTNLETMVGSILLRALPTLMMPASVAMYSFVLENITDPRHYPVAKSIDYEMLLTVPSPESNIYGLESSLESDIANQITALGIGDFFIRCQANVLGSASISISLDGAPAFDLVAPMYCDGSYTPVVASSTETLNTITYDVSSLLDSVYGSGAESISYNSRSPFDDFDNFNRGTPPPPPPINNRTPPPPPPPKSSNPPPPPPRGQLHSILTYDDYGYINE